MTPSARRPDRRPQSTRVPKKGPPVPAGFFVGRGAVAAALPFRNYGVPALRKRGGAPT
ncbi:protein of unknown function [Azospirillum baldaniorum]|uniref:Uncharacterized protein n=1 Tax=Azospirillum baldaniorum TaxID=1064539 RepID=A0A9P1JTD5_9PROT|nr:protein of unknown function [Azospirillum baldaniorum]